MKRTGLLILVGFLFPGYLPASWLSSTRTLRVNIEVTVGEHSMDSNSTTRVITIIGDRMTYAKSFHGRRGPGQKDFSRDIHLRGSQREALIQLVNRRSLSGSRTIDDPITGAGRYFTFEMRSELDKKKSSIKVSGPVTAFQNEDIYKDITALLEEIEALVD